MSYDKKGKGYGSASSRLLKPIKAIYRKVKRKLISASARAQLKASGKGIPASWNKKK